MRVLRLSSMPILQQLRLEEALLRADAGNWFLLNDGTPEPAVVMGISGCVQWDRCRGQQRPTLRHLSWASFACVGLAVV